MQPLGVMSAEDEMVVGWLALLLPDGRVSREEVGVCSVDQGAVVVARRSSAG